MVLFNYSTKEITAKIVYYGPGLCGKTTNLQFVYDNLPQAINRGKMLSLATKTDRTLFFDFLPIDLGTIRGMRTRLQLYTVPGQVFYNTTRKLVLKGADGVVFVADSQRRMLDANLESFRNLEENLAEHDMKLAEMPLIVQFNKRDLPDVAGVEELNAAINKYNAPIYEAVATTGIGVHETLKAITRLVLNSLKERYADKREQRAEPPAGVAAAAMAVAQARSQSGAPAGRMAPVAAPPRVEAAPPQIVTRSAAPPAPPAIPGLPSIEDEVIDIGGSEEMPTLDFAVPDLELSPAAAPVTDQRLSAEPFAVVPEPPGWAPAPPMATAGESSPATDQETTAGPFDGEDALVLEASEENVLELVETESEATTALPEGEDQPAPPLLDVTEELVSGDEPFTLDAGSETPTEFPAEPVAESFDVMEVDLEEAPEPPSVTASAKMAAFFDAALPMGDPRSTTTAPAEPVESAPTLEGRYEQTFDWDARVADTAAAIPVVQEGPAGDLHVAPKPDSLRTPMVPFTPMADAPGSPAVVREVTASELLAREIHLPIRLEIGGQTISFDLRIALDLATNARSGGGGAS